MSTARAVLAAILLPSLASATPLFTADGYLFEIRDPDFGDLQDGTDDAYDDWGNLCVSSNTTLTAACPPTEKFDATGLGAGTLDSSGRVLTTATWTHPTGLLVTREYFVPDASTPTTTQYVRIREILTNPTDRALSVLVRFGTVDTTYSNLGSDADTQITGTSDGSGTLAAGQTWVTTDDALLAGRDPSLTHVWGGPSGAVQTSSVSKGGIFQTGIDQLTVEWLVAVPPGGTRSVMHFEAQSPNSTEAVARAQALMTPSLDDLFGMDSDAQSSVVNWGFGGGGGVNLSINGRCPGALSIDITGLTAGSTFVAVRASSPGSATIPGGSCAGTTLHLSSPRVVGFFPTQGGSRSFMPSIGGGGCGDYIQVVDLATCRVSNLDQL